MADILKPVYGDVWANAGERLAPPSVKINSGWIQEMMPFQYENWIQHRQDISITYLFQKGVPEWSAEQEYIADKSIVTYATNLYMATATSTNVLPTVTTSWKRINTNSTPDGVVAIAGGGTGATSASSARTNLGLGTLATQNANAVAITGGTLTGITAAGAFTGNIVGNSSTATALQTPRTFTISGGATADPVSFNGTANILLNVLSLDATKLSGVASINTSGNAATASTLQTARTINVSGAATGSPTSFNGSADITIPIISLNATDLLAGTVPVGRLGNAVTKTSSTGSAQLPVGTTLQRDSSPVVGSIRVNTTNNNLIEYWNGTSWITNNGTDLGGLIGSAGYQLSTNSMNDLKYQSLTAAAAMSVADRNRENHTGTQLQTTIDGLVPRLTTIESNISGIDGSILQIEEDILNKQETLVSGVNIKTINGVTILGSGNIIASDAPIGTYYTGITHPETGTWLSTDNLYLKSSYPELFSALGLHPMVKNTPWTRQTISSIGTANGMAYGNDIYVISGSSSSTARYWTSTDGVVWTLRTGITAFGPAVFGNGIFVVLGAAAVSTSSNGTSWTTGAITGGTWSDIVFGDGIFVAVSTDGRIATSTNGSAWVVRYTTSTSESFQKVSYGNGKYIAAAGNGVVRVSTDGISWNSQVTAPVTGGGGVALIFADEKFTILSGITGAYSTTGLEWTTFNILGIPLSGNTFRTSTYIHGRYFAGGTSSSGVYSLFYESHDGINWSYVSSNPGTSPSLMYSANDTVFCFLGNVLWTTPYYSYNSDTQFYIPASENPPGMKSWIKAGL